VNSDSDGKANGFRLSPEWLSRCPECFSQAQRRWTFDTDGHLFPGRGADSSARYEKSMEKARRKTEVDVSNMLAIESDGEESEKVSN
jgi:hypothetical protein